MTQCESKSLVERVPVARWGLTGDDHIDLAGGMPPATPVCLPRPLDALQGSPKAGGDVMAPNGPLDDRSRARVNAVAGVRLLGSMPSATRYAERSGACQTSSAWFMHHRDIYCSGERGRNS
jgi:hypothetical protein